MSKPLLAVRAGPPRHWVGDGFPVRSLFSYQDPADHLSPFLLLDHAGPAQFTPATRPRGVGTHPHRGFETVTIVYAGEVAHRDSAGHGGLIGPGDVQWMTAGSGVLHEEFHSDGFTQRGGALEMAQLWIDLPARDKLTRPRYQTLRDARIPRVPLRDGGEARIVAGRLGEASGPAATFSELNVWDLRLPPGAPRPLPVPSGHHAIVVVLRGAVGIEAQRLEVDTIAVLGREGEGVTLETLGPGEAIVLLLSGVPLDQPVVGHGPFVMTSAREIEQAFEDFQGGRFGQIAPQELEVADPAR